MKWFKELVEVIEFGAGYYGACEGEPLWKARLLSARDVLHQAVASVVCHFGAHQIEDDSYAGPESGCMAGHCTRCGWSFHETLY